MERAKAVAEARREAQAEKDAIQAENARLASIVDEKVQTLMTAENAARAVEAELEQTRQHLSDQLKGAEEGASKEIELLRAELSEANAARSSADGAAAEADAEIKRLAEEVESAKAEATGVLEKHEVERLATNERLAEAAAQVRLMCEVVGIGFCCFELWWSLHCPVFADRLGAAFLRLVVFV